jgi:iron complex outermembrane receptor protein
MTAGLGHAQRAPDYWELFAVEGEALPSAFHIRPERTTQVDLGASLHLGRARLTVSGFLGWVEDFILIQSGFPKPSPTGDVSTTVARNIRARTWGGEATLAAPLVGPLRLDGSLACAWGENLTDGRPLAQIPPPETRLGLTWEGSAWSASVLARLVAPQDRFALRQGSIAGQDLGRAPGFAVFSLQAGWTPGAGGRFQVSAGIENLFDRAYAEAVNRASASQPGAAPASFRVPEPGRMIWIRLGMRASGH